MLLLDFCAADVRFRAADVWMLLPWPIWYGFFHTCWTAAGHDAIYFFLNMNSYGVAFILVGLLFVHALLYFLCVGIGRLRDRCCGRRTGGAATGGALNDEAEWGFGSERGGGGGGGGGGGLLGLSGGEDGGVAYEPVSRLNPEYA
jgi:hypothetical protein